MERRPAGEETRQPGGVEEGAVAASKRVAHGFDGSAVDLARAGEVREVVDETAVDRAVGGRGPGAQGVEVFEGAGVRLGPGGAEGFRALVGAGEAEDLVAVGEEFVW